MSVEIATIFVLTGAFWLVAVFAYYIFAVLFSTAKKKHKQRKLDNAPLEGNISPRKKPKDKNVPRIH